MVLPAVVSLLVLHRPAGFAVLLAAHGGVGVKFPEAFALLDAPVLPAVIALARRFDETRINDAAFAGDEPLALQHRSKGRKELPRAFAPFGFDSLLEVPQGFGIRDVLAHAQAQGSS